MFGNIGFSELLLIGLVALIVFGPQKLPELGRSLGKAIRELKQGARDIMGDTVEQARPERIDVTPPSTPPQAAQASAPQAQEASEAQPAAKPADSRRLPD